MHLPTTQIPPKNALDQQGAVSVKQWMRRLPSALGDRKEKRILNVDNAMGRPRFATPRCSAWLAAVCLVAAVAGCNRATPTAAESGPIATQGAKMEAPSELLPFTIKGTLPSGTLKDGDTVNLFVSDGKTGAGDGSSKPFATAVVKDGRFAMTGHVKAPMPAVLYFGDTNRGALMIVEQGEFVMTPAGADVSIRGGAINDLIYGFDDKPDYVAAAARQEQLSQAMYKLKPGSAAAQKAEAALAAQQAVVMEIQNAHDAKVLEGDAPPLAKLFVLRSNNDLKRFGYERKLSMLSELEKQLGPHPLLLRARDVALKKQQMESAQNAIVVGKPFVDVTATDKDGNKHKLSDVLAKHDMVLLDFWASWCGPCREQFPHLFKMRQKYAGKVEIFAISTDEDRAAWLKAIKEESAKGPMTWINLIDGSKDAKGAPSADAYGVQGLPDNYLIARNGTILGKQMYGQQLDAAIRKQLSVVGKNKG